MTPPTRWTPCWNGQNATDRTSAAELARGWGMSGRVVQVKPPALCGSFTAPAGGVSLYG
jgi:hypothetical protein